MSIMSDDDFVRLFQRTFGLTEDDGKASAETIMPTASHPSLA